MKQSLYQAQSEFKFSLINKNFLNFSKILRSHFVILSQIEKMSVEWWYLLSSRKINCWINNMTIYNKRRIIARDRSIMMAVKWREALACHNQIRRAETQWVLWPIEEVSVTIRKRIKYECHVQVMSLVLRPQSNYERSIEVTAKLRAK